MKKILILILTIFMAAIIAAILWMHTTNHPTFSNSQNFIEATNSPSMNLTNKTSLKDNNAVAKPNGFFKTIIDQQSGQYAIANSTEETVSLCDKNDDVIWSTNVVEALGALPTVGEKKIRSIQFISGNLIVYVGKDCFSIDIKTGATKYLGAN
jgi:uncharacterized GH25 family protein